MPATARTRVSTYRQEETGSTYHVISRVTRGKATVLISIWESPTGVLVALDNAYMAAHKAADTDPTPELMARYEPGPRPQEA